MKKLACVAMLALCASIASADIGVNWSSGSGFYSPSGSWAAGPWPNPPSLRQLLWSPSDPAGYQVDTSGFAVGQTEYLLATYGGSPDDYGAWASGSSASPIVRGNSSVGDNPINTGYLYARVFIDALPDIGDRYYQSPAAGPSLPVYDPQVIATLIEHDMSPTAGPNLPDDLRPLTLNRAVVPEPSVLAFLAVGSAIAAARRMRKAA